MEVEGAWKMLLGDDGADVGTTISLQDGIARRVDDTYDVNGIYEVLDDQVTIRFEWKDDQGDYKEAFHVRAMDANTLSGVLNADTDLIGDDPFSFSDPVILQRAVN